MPRVLGNALDADIFVISFAIKLERFVVDATKLMIFPDFLLVAGKL